MTAPTGAEEIDVNKTKLIEALRVARNEAEAAGEERIAERATLDIARLRRDAKKAEEAAEAATQTTIAAK
jgi:hypothetical protein